MKTKEELTALKTEYELLGKKLAKLTEDELTQVTGGLHNMPEIHPDERYVLLHNMPKKNDDERYVLGRPAGQE